MTSTRVPRPRSLSIRNVPPHSVARSRIEDGKLVIENLQSGKIAPIEVVAEAGRTYWIRAEVRKAEEVPVDERGWFFELNYGASVADPDEPRPSGGGLTTKADIPVGSGKIFPGEKVVVTQPAADEFKAFSAVCTHQGCVVSALKGKEIQCGCHGSKFSIEDGSVINGPAKKPLEELQVTAEGDNLTVA